MSYYVYILRTSSNTLYIGYAKNLEKRIAEHSSGSSRSAKYLRYFSSFELVYYEVHSNKSAAMQREHELKKWPKKRKEQLIKNAADARMDDMS